MGVTPKLNDVQKLAVILMMLAGRVGPLTLAFSFPVNGFRRRTATPKKASWYEEACKVKRVGVVVGLGIFGLNVAKEPLRERNRSNRHRQK